MRGNVEEAAGLSSSGERSHAGDIKLGVHCLLLVLKPGKITQRVIRDWKEVQALGPEAPPTLRVPVEKEKLAWTLGRGASEGGKGGAWKPK